MLGAGQSTQCLLVGEDVVRVLASLAAGPLFTIVFDVDVVHTPCADPSRAVRNGLHPNPVLMPKLSSGPVRPAEGDILVRIAPLGISFVNMAVAHLAEHCVVIQCMVPLV